MINTPARAVSIVFALVLLAGCASKAPLTPVDNWQNYQTRLQTIDHWQLSGKITVRTPDESDKARFSWRNNGESYRIRLSGTLGMGTTYIDGNPQQVKLEQNGEDPIVASNPEQLIYDQLGRDIPVSHLHYWVRGIAAPGVPAKNLRLSDAGLLAQLQQAGWQLSFSDYQAAGEWNLPGEIIALRDDIELTLSIYKWSLGDQ